MIQQRTVRAWLASRIPKRYSASARIQKEPKRIPASALTHYFEINPSSIKKSRATFSGRCFSTSAL